MQIMGQFAGATQQDRRAAREMIGAAPALRYSSHWLRQEVLSEICPHIRQPMSSEVKQKLWSHCLTELQTRLLRSKSRNYFLCVSWRDCLQHTE